MRNLKLTSLTAILIMALFFAGCGVNEGTARVEQPQTEQIQEEQTQEKQTQADTQTVLPQQPVKLIDTGKYVGISHPSPVLDNIIYDVDELDSTFFSTGNGPAADEYSRPYSALDKMKEFAKYQAYFVRDDVTEKVVYLTFDEGYEYGCTESILDTLKEKDVKAVFFVTLPYVKSEPQLVERMIAEGHIVGNHSVSHLSFPSLDTDTQIAEITELHEYMLDNFDYDMWLFRYPKGEYNEKSLAIVNNLGYASVFWSFAYLDYDVNNQPDINEAYEKLVNKLHSGAIYLLHAESCTNASILGDFIDTARRQGYTFERFDIVQENSYRE
jgi:delta-lactam-biosynthetic de-N-acetylase